MVRLPSATYWEYTITYQVPLQFMTLLAGVSWPRLVLGNTNGSCGVRFQMVHTAVFGGSTWDKCLSGVVLAEVDKGI